MSAMDPSIQHAGGACLDGARWGPASTCRTFDFTPAFENIILTILPHGVLLVLLFAFRFERVAHKPQLNTRLTPRDFLGVTQATFAALLLVLSIVVLACACAELGPIQLLALGGSRLLRAAQALEFVGTSVLLPAVLIERKRTRGGSFVLPIFFLATILFDGARLRTYCQLPDDVHIRSTAYFGAFAAMLGVRTILFLLSTNLTQQEQEASFVNRLGFFWLMPLIFSGMRSALTIDRLPPLAPRYETRMLGQTLRAAYPYSAMAQGEIPKSGLFMGLIRAFTFNLTTPILSKVVATAATLSQPYLIQDTIIFIGSYAGIPGVEPQPASKGWSLAGAFALVYTVEAVASSQYLFATKQNQVVISGALLEALYDKSVRLELSTATSLGSAKAVNLMSQDVQRIMKLIDPVHEIWSAIATVVVALYITWHALRTVFVVVVFLAFVILFGGPLAALPMLPAQAAWSNATDRRVRLTTSVFNSIKAIKMSALEDFFLRKLLVLRKSELGAFRKFSGFITVVFSCTHILGTSIPVITIVVFAAVCRGYPESVHYQFTAARVFTAINAISIMTQPLTEIGQQVGNLMTALASIKRLQDYLLSDEKVDNDLIDGKRKDLTDKAPTSASLLDRQSSHDSIALTVLSRQHDALSPIATAGEESEVGTQDVVDSPALVDASVGWTDKPVLSQVSLALEPGLTMVVGRLSAGKSTLLNAFLGETRFLSGLTRNLPRPITGAELVAYAPQDYWTQESMTIRANIVFYNPLGYDAVWYNKVIEACALKPDFSKWEQGDQRLARSLSGGQKQRINLARAVYAHQATMYILDDPLSAVDAKTEAHIWTCLFGPQGLLCGQRVLLASNAAFRIKDADRIVHVSEGRCELRFPSEAAASLAKDLEQQTSSADTTAPSLSAPTDQVENQARAQRDVHIQDDVQTSMKGQPGQDPAQLDRLDHLMDVEADVDVVEDDEDQNKMDAVFEKRVGLSSYMFWVNAARPWRVALLAIFLAVVALPTLAYQIYIQHWVDRRDALAPGTYGRLMGGLLALWGIMFVLSIYSLWFSFVTTTIPAGWNIHQRLIRAVLAAPMSFFTSRSSGQVVSRFSQDIFMVDMEWIMNLLPFVLLAISLLGSCIVMIITAPYTAITFVAALTISIGIRWMYLPNSRQMRRLEMAARSPLYTLFGDCTSGLAVIRAFGAVEPLRNVSTRYATDLQKATYSLFSAQQWLQTWLQIAATLMNVTLVLVVIGRRHSNGVSMLGVALTQSVQLSSIITWTITTLMEVEIVAIVFERLREFAKTASEYSVAVVSAQQAGIKPMDTTTNSSIKEAALSAPRAGAEIQFQDVSLAYDEGPEVLHKVSFTAVSGVRLGICGRSGSGKSTLLSALLRMQDISSGSILIDGVDIRSLSLEALRNSMTVVVQEPFSVEGLTVRDNLLLGAAQLDPEQDNTAEVCPSDDAMWSLLKETGLEAKISALPKKLATPMEDAGLSRGQSQILAVTRALLSDKSIVVLDEVTSSLDRESDLQIQRLLHAHAKIGKTVFTIAHRIEDIIDYDLVLVLDEGRVLELDSPDNLLPCPGGALRTLAALQGINVDRRVQSAPAA